MSSGIYTTPQGLNFYYNCPTGIHVWETRKLFHFRIMECLVCGAIDDCGLGPELVKNLLSLEARKENAAARRK